MSNSPDSEKKYKKVKFKYVFEDNFNPKYSNGGIFSYSPTGEITLNFYHERHAVPKSESFYLNDDNMIGDSIESNPDTITVIRYMQAGVTVNLEQAKSIMERLGETISKLEGEMEKHKGDT